MVRLQPELLTGMDNTDFQDKRYLEACTHLEVDPGTPTIDGLELILESYQVIGISWMRSMEEGPIGGGILGDFPDAGKSVQAIGLLVHSRNQWERDDRRNAPKLSLLASMAAVKRKCYVQLVSLQDNTCPHVYKPPLLLDSIYTRVPAYVLTAAEWFLKIRKYAPTLHIYHYHGGSEPLTINSRIFDSRDSSNESTVFLASYEFWSARHPGEPIREASGDEEFGAKDNRDPRGVLTGLFRRVICDEGHKLTGGSSRPRARSIISLASQYRHIHTATPMSNRVGDLVGLLEFLERPEFLIGVVGYLDPYTDPGMELAPNGKTFKLGVQRLWKLLGVITLARTAHSTVPEAVGYVYSAESNPSGLISEGILRVEVKTIEVEFDAEEWALWSAHAAPLWECLYQNVMTTTSGTKIKRMDMAIYRKLSVTSKNPLLLAAITNTEPDWRARGGGKEHYREDKNTMEYWIEVDFALMAGVDEPLETPLDRLAYIHNGQPKLSFLDRIVHDTITRKYSKLIVFVHWPIIGWLLEIYYKAIGFNVSVLHSGLSKGAREVMIYGFNHDTEPEILITSYGVGSCGVDLHLRCGSMVLYETAVNVQTEQQAIGRIHRRGQKEEQIVWRLVTVGSYQEFQQMMQLKKYTPIFECLRKEKGPLANKTQETLYKIMTGQEQKAGLPEYCKGWMEKYRKRAFPKK
ncbi:MAG: hypothetical protein M1813_002524 [Trichoglossum hirsutum]|nr:MAG: hypothetical protein M1813_002524 [Trichoglossum hirsutum]